MHDKVPYLDLPAQIRPLRKEIDAAIARNIDACSFCLGPDVVQFEKDFAKYCGAEHCVAFNSGTSALHVALMLLGIKQGDEVISTPHTFVATSWAISYVNAKPVYVDIDDATFNLDPALIEKAITPRTKAIVPVHLYGHPFDVDAIMAVAKKHNLPVVEDACQAHGAKYKGRTIGTFGAMSCYSFYPGKNLGAAGEGGALVTNNAEYAKRARSLREHGSTVRYYHDEERLASLRRAPSQARRIEEAPRSERRRLRPPLSAATAPAKVLRRSRLQGRFVPGLRKSRARMSQPADLP
jgi:dTDP-4-amino-4,6-dideoxygalactose transaminase